METNHNTMLSSDLCFLIQRFLSSSVLKKTLQVFNEELEEHKLLPTRTDWEGEQHDRTVEDMIRQFSNIRPDYLLQLCNQAVNSKDRDALSDRTKSFLSFRPNAFQRDNILTNFRQLYNYVIRMHGAPVQITNNTFNIANSLRGREISGPLSRHRITTPKLFNSMQKQRSTVGHLSSVFCILFDHSGKYIITGADDLLVKLWSAYTGRLISVFRGASSEITDIAINSENTLLAAGSIDRILRVWNLQNGAPIAVLTGHTGMITSVNFCPTQCLDLRYLISTGTDGSIAFWPYSQDCSVGVEFRSNPVMYQEKLRPGQAQMICSSFSPGGTFLATGSADHHVRVYYMKGDEGPHRILEMEAHSDRVDSIQWAHSGLRFLSGSKDGMAIIWWFERQQWKSIHLDMASKLSDAHKTLENDSKKLKVTMVCWDLSDYWVITAVSDNTLKVWTSSNGQLIKILTGHTDEIYVLEAHPRYDNVILSAGHDGQLFIWDIMKGEIVFKFLNNIEGQGFAAIYDVKWNPDGTVIAGSDSQGHILIFGFGEGSPFFKQLPQELFFHTDYRPLVRDTNHYVLDEQTQIPPHLMPPPFLVDIDGNPYPPMLQRLVPGREFCNVEQLIPNIIIGNEGTQEVIQDLPQNHIASLERNDQEEGSSFRPGRRSSVRDHERIRQSTGNWQSDPSFEWQKNILVQPLSKAVLERAKEVRESLKDAEMEEYQKQLRQRPHMISINTSNNIKKKEEKEKKKRKNNKYATRSAVTYEYKEDDHDMSPIYESDSYSSDWVAEEQERFERPVRSSRRQAAGTSRRKVSDNEDEDVDVELEDDDEEDYDFDESMPSSSKSKEKDDKKRNKPNSSDKNSRIRSSRRSKQVARKRNNKIKVTSSNSSSDSSSDNDHRYHNGNNLSDIIGPSTSGMQKSSKLTKIEQYRLSEWLSETKPRKSPYYPQLGDEIVYFLQGHQLYLDAVETKNVYEINAKELPWKKLNIQPHEFCKVIGIQYEIKPPRLCCLKLAVVDEEGHLTGRSFSVKYHDMPDVLDFIVLKQIYDVALSRSWTNGSKFRCMIDEGWWIGEIINKSPASETFPDSTFLCYQIRWNNGEEERMSPWDMEPIDDDRIPEDESESIPVLEEELSSILYKTSECDWPYRDLTAITKNIVNGLTKVMELAIAEPFLVPVDINAYPLYAMIIEYPIDLSTIKSRFENRFYRRLIAAQFDIRYLATNAEKFNEKRSNIVKHAKILTELCLRIVGDCSSCVDVPSLYHRLVSNYDSDRGASDGADERVASTSKNLRNAAKKPAGDPDKWKKHAVDLLNLICANEDSAPFRKPVDITSYPDYYQIVKNPMDLGTVQERLQQNAYDGPLEFSADMKLIFSNSRLYTPNKKSRIYDMTSHLSKIFEESFKKILSNWKTETKRRRRRRSVTNSESDASTTSSYSSDSATDVQEELKAHDEEEDDDEEEEEDSNFECETKSEPESDSQSEGARTKRSRKRARKIDKESEEEYTAKLTDQSEEECTSSEEDFDAKKKNNLRKRPARRKGFYDSDSEESSDSSSAREFKRIKRIRHTSDSDNSNQSYQTDGSDRRKEGKFVSQVSSRGRVRKLTERAKALFKKK
ncbi:unnamed protein product [Phyllotreta striolata]|uniref:Bromo domain-containing protein n=1 Tax=Phyllotreta striolata TaxID=444603 RepID=A0A9N9TVC7_PHYSR|nr:unnamed protein product [Phyllotreta striolata]